MRENKQKSVIANSIERVAEGEFDFVKAEHANFPPIIVVSVTNLCNMACVHCAHPVVQRSGHKTQHFMEKEVHDRIVQEIALHGGHIWMLRYASDGESLLHPHFLDFVSDAKAAGIGPIDLTTNGMTLSDDVIDRLLESEIDVIDVSIDAFTQSTYEKIRKRGNFEVVTNNLKRLLYRRNELRAPTKIMTSIIRQHESAAEVDDFVEYWGDRVDEVLVRGLNTDLGLVEVEETYFDETITRWPCPQFWKRVTINENGDIRFCVEDWWNQGVVANIMDTSIREVWQSSQYQQLRELHKTGRWNQIDMCRKCQDWQHMRWDHGFEKAIAKAMNTDG